MFDRSSKEAGVLLALMAPLGAVELGPAALGSRVVGLEPGWRDCKPRGVSRMTRKWPVKGGARVAGRASGSIYVHVFSQMHHGHC
jgi:hypothetical protein